jgi:hypothetical protein
MFNLPKKAEAKIFNLSKILLQIVSTGKPVF